MTVVEKAARHVTEIIAQKIQERQDVCGLTNQEVADLSGVSKRTYENYKQGNMKWPQPDTLEAIAEALDINLDDLDIQIGSNTHTSHMPQSGGDGAAYQLTRFTVKDIEKENGRFTLRATDQDSPIAFAPEFAEEHLMRSAEDGFEMRVPMSAGGGKYYPGQRLWVRYTHNRMPRPADYFVRIGESWGLYAVQRLPNRRVRFAPIGEAGGLSSAFELDVTEDERLDASDVEVVGLIVARFVSG